MVLWFYGFMVLWFYGFMAGGYGFMLDVKICDEFAKPLEDAEKTEEPRVRRRQQAARVQAAEPSGEVFARRRQPEPFGLHTTLF